jgi:endoribonuclease Dicer
LCEKLEWEFHDQSMLFQALTHPCYMKNRMTDNYQRLEFLGDAVLDYLVTCYIFCEFPNYTPGQITDARSALVNNITFAEIAVKELKLHKHLFHLLPTLFKHISEYVEFIENDSDINDEVSVQLYCSSNPDENITLSI